jgi:hypothetical protein
MTWPGYPAVPDPTEWQASRRRIIVVECPDLGARERRVPGHVAGVAGRPRTDGTDEVSRDRRRMRCRFLWMPAHGCLCKV